MKRILAFMGLVSVSTVIAASVFTAPAYAWHPKGQIKKYVTNVTQNGQQSDANAESSAVAAKPGDVLKYTIVVSNAGAADNRGWNDMAKTKLTDTLPAGVELVSNPANRTITEDLGLIKPGKSVTKEYQVKVTSDKDKTVITNKACFTGDSTANDSPQQGCDTAVVKVSVPVTPTPPTTPEPPVEPPVETPEQPEVLPNTGIGNIVAPVLGVGAIAYMGNLLRIKRSNS
jgi:uncharacterized repeat protein (TIGR01451 family)